MSELRYWLWLSALTGVRPRVKQELISRFGGVRELFFSPVEELAGLDMLTDEEREAKGINHSILHVDFMVGSDDMSIRGQKQDGTWEDVFVNGRWAW